MVNVMEIGTCIAVAAFALNVATAEYRKYRNARRCTEALRRTFCGAFVE